MMVRTRVVTDGSAGSGECPIKAPVVAVDLEEHRLALHPNRPKVVLAIGVVVGVKGAEARDGVFD
jgi:hypothetical protein